MDAELAQLGEAALDDDERAHLHAHDQDDEPREDTAFVARLLELGDGEAFEDLDELGARRAWAETEARWLEAAGSRAPARAVRPVDPDPARGDGPARSSGGRVLTMLLGVAALAAAVLLAFVVMPRDGLDGAGGSQVAAESTAPVAETPEAGPTRAELDALALQARTGLEALGVDETSASRRARSMRDDYRTRLDEEVDAG